MVDRLKGATGLALRKIDLGEGQERFGRARVCASRGRQRVVSTCPVLLFGKLSSEREKLVIVHLRGSGERKRNENGEKHVSGS